MKYSKIIDELNKIYPNLIFKYSKKDYSAKDYIIYKEKNNKGKEVKYDDILNNSFEILKKFFTSEEIKNIAIVYDYSDEILLKENKFI